MLQDFYSIFSAYKAILCSFFSCDLYDSVHRWKRKRRGIHSLILEKKLKLQKIQWLPQVHPVNGDKILCLWVLQSPCLDSNRMFIFSVLCSHLSVVPVLCQVCAFWGEDFQNTLFFFSFLKAQKHRKQEILKKEIHNFLLTYQNVNFRLRQYI